MHGSELGAVEVVAHRGASADEPEHTLAAYRYAARLGADAVECDVRMTRDGALVCVHDRRIDRTSTGRGVISALDLADLERFKFGRPRTMPGRRRAQLAAGIGADETLDEDAGRVLTLDRLLEYVTSTPGRVRLAIETKHPTRHSPRVEAALVATLRRFGLVVGDGPVDWAGRPAVRVMSFSPAALRRVQDLTPGMPTVQLVRQLTPWTRITGLPPVNTAVAPSLGLLRRVPSYVRRAHDAGAEVHVWTVNQPEDMELVLSLGVDAVITDHPGTLLRRLGRDPAGRTGESG
ncbi:glycerophosphodiester phosphodiesterase [Geodermatophilus chilensis]|uniref:glycerophosphodiester phosphodiesterase n=1 Tax=Geodermatophilus chilensis TaxID=2035835 RepID=UPI001E36E66B|nr:glycerophosphodiester phosphodiesterase family protein [Geodermatophilus chilensis]